MAPGNPALAAWGLFVDLGARKFTICPISAVDIPFCKLSNLRSQCFKCLGIHSSLSQNITTEAQFCPLRSSYLQKWNNPSDIQIFREHNLRAWTIEACFKVPQNFLHLDAFGM